MLLPDVFEVLYGILQPVLCFLCGCGHPFIQGCQQQLCLFLLIVVGVLKGVLEAVCGFNLSVCYLWVWSIGHAFIQAVSSCVCSSLDSRGCVFAGVLEGVSEHSLNYILCNLFYCGHA